MAAKCLGDHSCFALRVLDGSAKEALSLGGRMNHIRVPGAFLLRVSGRRRTVVMLAGGVNKRES